MHKHTIPGINTEFSDLPEEKRELVAQIFEYIDSGIFKAPGFQNPPKSLR